MMKSKKFYLVFLMVVVAVVLIFFSLNNKVSEEELKVKDFYPNAKRFRLLKIFRMIYLFL